MQARPVRRSPTAVTVPPLTDIFLRPSANSHAQISRPPPSPGIAIGIKDPFRPITAPKYSPQPATKLPRLEAEIEEMRRQQKKLGYPPDTKTYADLIWSCSKENQIELAMQLFQEMKSAGLIPSASIYTNLISIYGRNGDYEKALHLLAEMKVDGHQPKEVSYEALMQACKKASKYDRVLELFEEMKSVGAIPDLTVYNHVLEACSMLGKTEQATMVMQEMVAAGVKPDKESFRCILNLYLAQGRIDLAEDLVNYLRSFEIIVDDTLYPVLIMATGKIGRVDLMVEYFELWKQSSDPPRQNAYLELIQHLATRGHFQIAVDYLSEFKSVFRTVPPQAMYHRLIAAAGCNGDMRGVTAMLQEMRKTYAPNESTYGALVDAAYASKEVQYCIAFYHEAIFHKKILLTLDHLIRMVELSAQHDRVAEALPIVDQFLWLGSPTRRVWNSLVLSLLESGCPEEAKKYFDEMLRRGFKPIYTCKTLFKEYGMSVSW